MPPKEVKKIADKLTDSEKKKIKQENKAKANPTQAAAKKEKSDAKRERRKVSSSQSPPLPPHHSPATGHQPPPDALPAPCRTQESGSSKSFS
tara:strand:+ start:315 stop:590 length:276 start_codon:yes stop_codon:yes gene_type:complete